MYAGEDLQVLRGRNGHRRVGRLQRAPLHDPDGAQRQPPRGPEPGRGYIILYYIPFHYIISYSIVFFSITLHIIILYCIIL